MINSTILRNKGARVQPCKRRGTTAVEVAIVLPILFSLLFAAIDFSRANAIRNTAENAAYEGARRAIVPGATRAAVKFAAQDILDILAIKSAKVTVSPHPIRDSTEQVTVTVSVPLGRNLYASGHLLSGSTITKTCTLTREQFAANPRGP